MRGVLIRRAVGLVVGGVGIAGAPATASALPSAHGDAALLGLALRLEHAQAALYAEASGAAWLRHDLREFARAAAHHEAEHVAVLRSLLGPSAPERPRVELAEALAGDDAFAHVAIGLEHLSVIAHTGRVAALTAAAREPTTRIASVDARHGAWLRALVGMTPEHRVVDAGRSSSEVGAALTALGVGVRATA